MKQAHRFTQAFTIIELLAVVAVIVLLASMLLPAHARTKGAARRILCSNNLRQVGTATHVWALSHGDAFPMDVAAANGGYADYIGERIVTPVQSTTRGVFGAFLVMSNELRTPRILFCPSENERRLPATTFSPPSPNGLANVVPFTNDLNTSYFIGVDAAPSSPRMFLSGDHNLGSDGNMVPLRGFVGAPQAYFPDFKVSLGTNFAPNAGVAWLNTMHTVQGNVVLANGTVQQFSRSTLQSALRNSGDTGGGRGPNFSQPIGCTGLGVNRIQFP
jgi:type II secretory pathway pseudopilin PulG